MASIDTAQSQKSVLRRAVTSAAAASSDKTISANDGAPDHSVIEEPVSRVGRTLEGMLATPYGLSTVFA